MSIRVYKMVTFSTSAYNLVIFFSLITVFFLFFAVCFLTFSCLSYLASVSVYFDENMSYTYLSYLFYVKVNFVEILRLHVCNLLQFKRIFYFGVLIQS